MIILGGGLTGLSAAYHIGRGCAVFEAEDVPGGLLRTRAVDGYLFDYTGHFLHLKDDYARKLITGLLGKNLAEHARNSAIFSKGVFTGYPFQANTYGLPEDAARECVEGFIEAPGRTGEGPAPANFADWITYHFGIGIARHFMHPYNRKLWRYPLTEMSVEAIAPYVPVPSVEDIKRGATEEGARGLGYNAKFYYPLRGGIYSLVEAMIPHIRDLSLGQRAVEIDTRKRSVRFSTGYTAFYDKMISTIPLPELVKLIKDAPEEIKDAAARLKYISVYDVNLGVARERISPYHWIYFPEPKFTFFRAGFLTNLSERMAPPGCTALFAEVSHTPDEHIPAETLAERCIEGLKLCGILRDDDDVPVRDVVDIKYAYVVFDDHAKAAVPAIMEYLRSKDIISAGRYGAWEYSGMEEALLEGRDAAGVALKGL